MWEAECARCKRKRVMRADRFERHRCVCQGKKGGKAAPSEAPGVTPIRKYIFAPFPRGLIRRKRKKRGKAPPLPKQLARGPGNVEIMAQGEAETEPHMKARATHRNADQDEWYWSVEGRAAIRAIIEEIKGYEHDQGEG
jgi:hypothetical protein